MECPLLSHDVPSWLGIGNKTAEDCELSIADGCFLSACVLKETRIVAVVLRADRTMMRTYRGLDYRHVAFRPLSLSRPPRAFAL